MDNEENWRMAGRIASKALERGVELAKKGSKMLDVVNGVEAEIARLGGMPAFPAQMNVNAIAAHFCPEEDDEIVFTDQVVCLDVGGAFQGCMGDNATTIDFSGNHKDLVKAPADALKAALELIKPGVELREVGKVIHQTIKDAGFNPIRNLSGHGLGINQIHTYPTLPNIDNGDKTKIEEGMYLACEPFATPGSGVVVEKGDPSVFALTGIKPVRVGFVRDILKHCQQYEGRPFTTRWITKKFPANQVRYAFNQFIDAGILHAYPPLVEKSNGLVSQAEKSFLVTSSGAEVLTK